MTPAEISITSATAGTRRMGSFWNHITIGVSKKLRVRARARGIRTARAKYRIRTMPARVTRGLNVGESGRERLICFKTLLQFRPKIALIGLASGMDKRL